MHKITFSEKFLVTDRISETLKKSLDKKLMIKEITTQLLYYDPMKV